MSKKIVGILSILLVATLIVAVVPSYATPDVEAFEVTLKDQLGAAVYKGITEVRLIVWNADTLIVDAVGGTPDTSGKVLLTPTVAKEFSGDVNVTILVKTEDTGDQYLLFYYEYPVSISGLSYFNTTFTGNRWWNFKFKVVTDPSWTDKPDWAGTIPLWFPDPERPGVVDKPYVKLYLGKNETYPVITELETTTGGVTPYFNFTDSLASVDSEGHVTFSDVVIYKEVWWNYKRVIVGKELVKIFHNASGSFINVTDKIAGETYISVELSATTNEIEDRAYTVLVGVNLTDWDGNDFEPGVSEAKVFWEFEGFVLRSGKVEPGTNYAPAEGKEYAGTTYFWLPDVWTVYGKNATLEVTYLRVLVFQQEFNITSSPVTETAKLQVVKLALQVKDKEPIAQPVAGARIEIYYKGQKVEFAPGMTFTVTGHYWGDGWAYLPPLADYYVTTGGDLVVDTVYSGYGYLPVPLGSTEDTYTVKVYFKFGDEWIDVTDTTNNTITVKLSEQGKTFMVQAKLYEASFIFKSYAKEVLSINDFEDARVYVYYGGKLVLVTVPGTGGEVILSQIPAGEYSFKLYWKWVTIDPYPGNATVTVTDNIITKPVIYFPIVNLKVNTFTWDKQPVAGLKAAVFYNVSGTWKLDPQGWVKAAADKTYIELKKIPANIPLRFRVNTSDVTPGIRSGEDNILVYESDEFVVIAPTLEDYLVVKDVYTWIFSFKLVAADCEGTPLKGVSVYDPNLDETVYYNVTILLVDTDDNFKLINITDPYDAVAQFDYLARQDGISSEGVTHLFIAGQSYTFRVFYLGTLVFDYTIKLPKPYETKFYYVNETSKEILTEVPEVNATYHPLYEFTGVPEPSDTVIPEVKIYTWVVPLKIYTTTISGASKLASAYLLPNVKLVITLKDILEVRAVNGTPGYTGYSSLADTAETKWANNETYVTITTKTDEKGETEILVPVWVPKTTGHFNDIKFGANITRIEAYGSQDDNTPGFVLDVEKLINYGTPEDYARNVTTWCGDWTWIPTEALEHILVRVLAPSRVGSLKGVAGAKVTFTLDSATVAEVSTDANGEAHFWVPKDGTYTLPNGTTLPVVAVDPELKGVFYTKNVFTDYTYETDLEAMVTSVLENYGTVKRDGDIIYLNGQAVMRLEKLTGTVDFTEDYNCGSTPITLEWGALMVRVLDWAGQPLRNMTVFATSTDVTEGTLPFIYGITDGEGIALLYVSGSRKYYVDVYWRDTYFLFYAGKIPKYINIYASAHDEEAPSNRIWSKGEYREIKVYVYKVAIKLLKADGTSLSNETLTKIKAKITWPDNVVTEVAPTTDGSVNIILNAETVKDWTKPTEYSIKNFNPLSPSNQPQTPPGGYKVEIFWEGIEKPIYTTTITVERGKYETPKITVGVKLPIFDLEFKVVSPFGTPLANAEVSAVVEGVGTVSFTLDAEGKGVIKEVPLGKAVIKSVTWKGVNVLAADKEVTPTVTTVQAANIGKLTIKVTGAMGQPDTETVSIEGPVSKTIKVEGSYTEEVPAGDYTVNGKKVTVNAESEATVEISTGRLFGVPYSTFITYIVGIIIAILIIAIILYEYTSYRTSRRLAKAIAPAKPEK